MTTPPLTNPLLDPAHLQMLAQQSQQSAPPIIRPPSTDTPPPAVGSLGMPSDTPSLTPPPSPTVTRIPTQLDNEKTEQARKVNTGSGISQIASKVEGTNFGQAHPLVGKLLGGAAQGLATLGDVGLRAVAPAVDIALPGTSLHHIADLNQGQRQIASDEENAEKEAQTGAIGASTAHTNAETAEIPQAEADRHSLETAQIGNLNSEAKDRDAAVQNPTLVIGHAHAVDQAIKNGRDPSTDPLVQQYEKAIQSTIPGFSKPTEGPKTVTSIRPGSTVPHEYAWNPKTNAYDIDEGQHYEKPNVVNVNAGITALDRETKQFGSSHQKAVDAANAQLEKIEDARSMINGNAESQALGVPKVLTALVGGQGTGVRITTPELNAIAKARGLSGDVEGTLNKWAGQGSLTKTQQQQLTSIIDAVKQRILQKQSIASEALDNINGASSRDQIVQADKTARQKLSDMEKGGDVSGSSSPQRPSGVPANYVWNEQGNNGKGSWRAP